MTPKTEAIIVGFFLFLAIAIALVLVYQYSIEGEMNAEVQSAAVLSKVLG
jgi:hypothetical protein